MIELQTINHILEHKSLAILTQNNIDSSVFVTYAAEADYIFNHHKKYGAVPDMETFLDSFPDFDIFKVTESEQYMVDTLSEQNLYNHMVPFLNKVNELTQTDSEQAVMYAVDNLQSLAELRNTAVSGYNIIANAGDRQKEYNQRLAAEGLMGITTGIDEFDEATHGWLPGEDLIVILGRTNEGKTWVLLFFLVAAWISGKRVLLYSGEMPKNLIGFRFDTLKEHFSHTALTTGSAQLGDNYTPESYDEYINGLSSNADNLPPFVVVTQKDFGGRKPTVSDIEAMAVKMKADMIGLDQLSLMADQRDSKGLPERLRYTHISEDLYILSEKLGVPIMTPAQASRASVGGDDEEVPEVHEIAESDGIGQNATRVIGMRQIENTLKLKVQKSRYSKKGVEIVMLWDIDRGIIKPFMQTQGAPGPGGFNGGGGSPAPPRPIANGQTELGGEELF